MLIWKGLYKEYIHFSIGGYQFPHLTEDYDANWLFLNVDVKNEQGIWTKKSACILTWEVSWYSRWLKNVILGNCEIELSVLEGDFKLIYIDKAQYLHRLMVCLEYELAYEAPKNKQRDKSIIGVCLSDTEIEESAIYFDRVFELYPPRGKLGEISYASFPGIHIFDNDDVVAS